MRSPTPEQQGRIALSDDELAIALGAAKPIGVSISDVLLRMRRDKLIRDVATRDGRRPLRSAAPAGRRLLAARDGSVSGEEWRVSDAGSLAELIYRELRPGREGFRPAVQAIGRLSNPRFDVLTDELRASGLLEPATEDLCRLVLTDARPPPRRESHPPDLASAPASPRTHPAAAPLQRGSGVTDGMIVERW
ncbi:hypothetical protein [Candidatus Solirubrobacter pratensis]|uniref:hypothetical protein n=1 Tax=Candidatus Solirubrobacter pratensis TaxID=1298857 RepID=UPI0012DF7DAE|nr:hypothetical protein [Candidatus Solirubrobacter pratensis]